MPIWQRTYLAACAAMVGFSLAYTMSDYGRWPRFTYFPYEREWRLLSSPPGPVPMNYVGTFLWGLGGAVFAAALVWFGCRLLRKQLTNRALHLAGGWALLSFAYACAYFLWNLWPF